jgi:hypothetical protein
MKYHEKRAKARFGELLTGKKHTHKLFIPNLIILKPKKRKNRETNCNNSKK